MSTVKPPAMDLARIEIKTLVTEIQKREHEVRRLIRRRAALAKQLATLDARIVSLGGCPRSGLEPRAKLPRRTFSLKQALRELLKHQPMGIPRIVPALPTVGYRSDSPNLRTMVNLALLDKNLFTRVERGVYIARTVPAAPRLARAA